MSSYRMKVRTVKSDRPFTYISDSYELSDQEAYEEELRLRKLGGLTAVRIRVDGELVVINPRHIVAVHRTELEEES